MFLAHSCRYPSFHIRTAEKFLKSLDSIFNGFLGFINGFWIDLTVRDKP